MNCPCEEKGPSKCLPKEVVEKPILFRLVKIASTIGDETAYPPTVGLYRNVLLNYEVNNHSYLYSSDGIPVFLETSVPQSVYDDLDNLQQEIDDIESSRSVWTGNETTESGSGIIANITTETGDFKWKSGAIVTVNFKYKANRTYLKIDSAPTYEIDNVRSLSGGIDSGVAIQYVCTMVNGQQMYRGIGRLRASSDVAGPVYVVDDLTTASSTLKALSANQGKVLKELIDATAIRGGAATPTSSTVGSVGTLYSCVNSGTPEIYMCTAVSGNTYTWTKVI